MYPSVMLRCLLATLLLALLTACSSTSIAPVSTSTVRPTSLPATTVTTQPATPPVTGGIDPSSLTGRIVFDNFEDIYVVNADGTNVQQLTHKPGPEFDPMWSPDGQYIVYRDSSRGTNQDDEIYVMNADGSGQTNLTNNPANDWGPAWSPDGSKIAFSSGRDDCGISTRSDCKRSGDIGPFFDIWIMNADGSGQTRLTQVPGQFSAWSPDGCYIVFSWGRLFIMNVDGSNVTFLPIAGATGEFGFMDWRP